MKEVNQKVNVGIEKEQGGILKITQVGEKREEQNKKGSIKRKVVGRSAIY